MKVFVNRDFSGGLNQAIPADKLNPKFTPEAKNVIFDEISDIVSKKGYDYFGSTNLGAPIMGLRRYYKQNGLKYLIAVSGGDVMAHNGTGYSQIDTGIPLDEFVDFEVWKDKVFYICPTNGLSTWDGTTVTDIANAPKGAYIADHVNRLWIAGDPVYSSRLYFSRLGDENNWNDPDTLIDNYIDLTANDEGDKITGLVSSFGELFIFKNKSTWVLHGSSPDTFDLDRILPKTGCIAPRSIAAYQGMIVFLASSGVWVLDKGGIMNISIQVQPILDACTIPEQAAGAIVDNKYYLAYSEDGVQNDHILVYDFINENWTRIDNIYVNVFAEGYGLGENNRLFAGDSRLSTGLVYELNKGTTDLAQPISISYKTPIMSFDSPYTVKLFRRFKIEANQPIDVKIETENQTFTFTTDGIKSLPNINGKTIQLTFTKTSDTEIRISGFMIEYMPRRFPG